MEKEQIKKQISEMIKAIKFTLEAAEELEASFEEAHSNVEGWFKVGVCISEVSKRSHQLILNIDTYTRQDDSTGG